MNWDKRKLIKLFIDDLEKLPLKDAVFNNNDPDSTVVVKHLHIKKLASKYRKQLEKMEGKLWNTFT